MRLRYSKQPLVHRMTIVELAWAPPLFLVPSECSEVQVAVCWVARLEKWHCLHSVFVICLEDEYGKLTD